MDTMYTQSLIDMGASLAELAVKGTVSTVSKKIRAAKEIKEIERLRSTYDEIINEILLEREEAVRIAQAYKSELEKIIISDEDIEHLHNTVARFLEIIKAFQLTAAATQGEAEFEKVKKQVESYDQIKELISVDTLKTMQLLGFNYKAAIGDPLTQICANAISNWGTKQKQNSNKQNGLKH